MNKKEAIEKIKTLGPKDIIYCKTTEESIHMCDIVSELGYFQYITDKSIKEKSNITYIDIYGREMLFRGHTHNIEGLTIHPASDFLGWEEEEKENYIVDGVKYDNKIICQSKNEAKELCRKMALISKLAMREKDLNTGKYHVLYILHEDSENEINLHSTVNQMGDIVDQEIHFVCGSVRTIENIDTSLIEQSIFTTLVTDKLPRDINTENVAYVRIKSKSVNVRPGTPTPLIFHLVNDHKVTIKDIIPSTKKLGELIKYRCSNGDMVLIQRRNLNAIEG